MNLKMFVSSINFYSKPSKPPFRFELILIAFSACFFDELPKRFETKPVSDGWAFAFVFLPAIFKFPNVFVNVPPSELVKFPVAVNSVDANWFTMNLQDVSFDDGFRSAPHRDNWQNLLI